jgi:hypothetical protein
MPCSPLRRLAELLCAMLASLLARARRGRPGPVIVAVLVMRSLAATAQPLAGDFVHVSAQGPVTLSLRQQGSAVAGTMKSFDGTEFRLEGVMRERAAEGSIHTGGDTGYFAAGFVDGRLKLVVAELDPATARPDLARAWNLDFSPAAGGTPAGRGTGGQAGRTAAKPEAEPATARDAALVGHWVHSKTYQSGDFFGTTTVQMQVNADGTYLYGRGNVSLGGAYIGNTGTSDQVTQGQWRTQGGVVLVKEPGSSQWTPHARYHVEGASMLFTFGDGSRQLWRRGR